eukprot:5862248-Amphidinium_carterae.1
MARAQEASGGVPMDAPSSQMQAAAVHRVVAPGTMPAGYVNQADMLVLGTGSSTHTNVESLQPQQVSPQAYGMVSSMPNMHHVQPQHMHHVGQLHAQGHLQHVAGAPNVGMQYMGTGAPQTVPLSTQQPQVSLATSHLNVGMPRAHQQQQTLLEGIGQQSVLPSNRLGDAFPDAVLPPGMMVEQTLSNEEQATSKIKTLCGI